MGIADSLREPRLDDISIDSEDRIAAHRLVLDRKPMIRGVFEEFYRDVLLLDQRYFGETPGIKVEIGAGVSMLKTLCPDVLITDAVSAPHLDRTLDAMDMDLPDGSVRALYGINCFHHFGDVRRFFREVLRVAPPGGGVILIEPYFGPFGAFLYRRLFASEDFDTTREAWEQSDSGPMAGANQALSFNVFFRDQAIFEAEFPDLEIVRHERLHNYLRHLLSGGLNFRQVVPNWAIPLVKGIEFMLKPIEHLFALHHVIVLRHRDRAVRD